MIDTQLRLALAIRLRHEQRARSQLNIARRRTTRTRADVDVLERRLANDVFGYVQEEIDSWINTGWKEISQLVAPGLSQNCSGSLCRSTAKLFLPCGKKESSLSPIVTPHRTTFAEVREEQWTTQSARVILLGAACRM